MTTQDYINAEIERESQRRAQEMGQWQRVQEMQNIDAYRQAQMYGNPGPSEVILLRAKVRELEDKLAAERARCAKIAREEESRWDRECTPDTVRPHPGNVAQRIALLIEAGDA